MIKCQECTTWAMLHCQAEYEPCKSMVSYCQSKKLVSNQGMCIFVFPHRSWNVFFSILKAFSTTHQVHMSFSI